MVLAPTNSELVARARADLRLGLPIVINGEGRLLVAIAAEELSPERLDGLRALPGEVVMAITSWRASTLKARAYDGDLARIAVPAEAKAAWIHCLADPARDLENPMKGPFNSLRDGEAELYRLAVQLSKSAHLLPAVVAVDLPAMADGEAFEGLTQIPGPDIAAELAASHALHPVAGASLPMTLAQYGRLHVFRPENGGVEHYAVEIGRPQRDEPVLARLHSACFTGDVLGSLKCDCGPQLHSALAAMNEAGSGILLYLNQEGRGIGLANKMRAYALQDQGFDTVEANHRLGFEDDERDFRIGAALLRKLGFERARLMTNNPRKVEMLAAEGVEVVERVPLVAGANRFNEDYLDTKRSKSGHIL